MSRVSKISLGLGGARRTFALVGVAAFAAVTVVLLHDARTASTSRAAKGLYTDGLIGRTVMMHGRRFCCGDGAAIASDSLRGALVWAVSAEDCTVCNAAQVAYWRELEHRCRGARRIAIVLVSVGRRRGEVESFARRYGFPGHVFEVETLAQLGLGTALEPPVWLALSSAGRVALSASVSPAGQSFPELVANIGALLGSCVS